MNSFWTELFCEGFTAELNYFKHTGGCCVTCNLSVDDWCVCALLCENGIADSLLFVVRATKETQDHQDHRPTPATAGPQFKVCVCVCVCAHTHTHTQKYPGKHILPSPWVYCISCSSLPSPLLIGYRSTR